MGAVSWILRALSRVASPMAIPLKTYLGVLK
jgi:hypothetical protein